MIIPLRTGTPASDLVENASPILFWRRKSTIQIEKQANLIQALRREMDSRLKNEGQNYEDKKVPCCFTCYKILEMYKIRHAALVFRTETHQESLQYIVKKQVEDWTSQDILFLVQIYKYHITNKVIKERMSRNTKEMDMFRMHQRFRSVESVTKQSTKTIPSYMEKQEPSLAKLSKSNSISGEHFYPSTPNVFDRNITWHHVRTESRDHEDKLSLRKISKSLVFNREKTPIERKRNLTNAARDLENYVSRLPKGSQTSRVMTRTKNVIN